MEFADLITTIGFPAVVCLWFMLRTEKLISENTKALLALKDMIEQICYTHK